MGFHQLRGTSTIDFRSILVAVRIGIVLFVLVDPLRYSRSVDVLVVIVNSFKLFAAAYSRCFIRFFVVASVRFFVGAHDWFLFRLRNFWNGLGRAPNGVGIRILSGRRS
jgi:hypothetical protein